MLLIIQRCIINIDVFYAFIAIHTPVINGGLPIIPTNSPVIFIGITPIYIIKDAVLIMCTVCCIFSINS